MYFSHGEIYAYIYVAADHSYLLFTSWSRNPP